MKSRSCGNAALVAFAAQLLDVDVSSAGVPPSRPSSSSSLRRPSASSVLRRSSLGAAFVNQEPASRPGRPSSSRPTRISKRARVVDPPSAVSPRYYVDSTSSSSSSSTDAPDEVLVHYDGEFSLLKPHFEFNELDLQELFLNKELRAGADSSSGLDMETQSARAGSVSGPSSLSTSSQLYEDFEEVEIGHFRAPHKSDEREPTGRGNSPFFFASLRQDGSQAEEDLDAMSLTMPPWLSLNQARFAPMKLRKLQRDLGPHLSGKEIEKVVAAIHMASGDDRKKVAGAADFCSILVNSLEMTDVPALCAAAFHYSSLVSVRENELCGGSNQSCSLEEKECLKTAGSDAKYLCALAGCGIENFGTHAVKIALDAARLKSMETLAAKVVRKNGRLGRLRFADAQNLRSLLLTVNDEGDWRALAVRSAACLYRLEGLEAHRSLLSPSGWRRGRTRVVTPDESRTSQEALHIYAPLAARLGMFRLKTELEDAAFRTLYPRSHAKVSALCGGENTNSVGEGMKSILGDISHQMKRLVQEDCSFMDNIENVSVTARVKEPYSVWRKMLKISKEGKGRIGRGLSILDIPDAVAIRVVFSARKLTPDESDTTTQRREKELCYYMYDLCTRNWPESSDSRFKDYVKNPKDNGYQSLHYSTRKRWRGTEWPFEVQIRSADMHRVAEYGVAAHWSYKRNGIDAKTAPIGHARSPRVPRLDRTSEAYLKSAQEWRTKQATLSYVAPAPELEEPSQYLEEEMRRQRKRERDEAIAPYLEALSGAQTDMTRENVFVFVSVRPITNEGLEEESLAPSEGTVLSLPAGSRVLDAIRVTEKWSSALEPQGHLYDGRSEFVALRNGLRTSSLGTELLASGDVVSIVPTNDLIVNCVTDSWMK